MSDLVHINSTSPLPLPDAGVSVRVATIDDFGFIDALQKKHSKAVGWMPRKSMEQKIGAGHIIMAEDAGSAVGYCVASDQYFKRDDVGIIYQMNVLPGKQRAFVGATLLKAQFERSAWGCRLYCCWCAQDLEANKFWEAMGFVPLAFRAGSEKKARVHIFWQKRIRAGDATTPWWFPAKTAGGSIREDRLVLPIPPGVHWSEVNVVVQPPRLLPDQKAAARPPRPKKIVEAPIPVLRRNGLMYPIPKQGEPLPEVKPPKPPKPKAEKVKHKYDPKMVSAARELRDRWLEQLNASPALGAGKYDVSRVIEDQSRPQTTSPLLLPAA